jgi:glycerol-3-phosphate dehydrogenase
MGLYDCIIVGAGVVGLAIAREMAQYTPRVLVIESNNDLCEGTSKANSAIVHAGYDAKPGTHKARLNLLGGGMFPSLCAALDVPYERTGALVLCFDEDQRPDLMALLSRGEQNGVLGLRIVERDALAAMEPNISPSAVCALYAPTSAIVCPFTLCVALGENAAQNGAAFAFERTVSRIVREDGGFSLYAGEDVYRAKTVVNAAGVHADEVARMASGQTCNITPRRGEYCVFDKQAGELVRHTLFQLPGPMGKGVLVTRTVHGNLMVGPNADDILDKQDTATTRAGLEYIVSTAAKSVKALPANRIIASFAGLRAHPEDDYFHIGEDANVKGLFHAAGIESPGLTAAPAIGCEIAASIASSLGLQRRNDAVTTRRGIARFAHMNDEERARHIENDPAYGQIICRCETVTEAEIVDAIRRVPGATTIDGVKRRTRCGMGRCQGGFCAPKVAAILARELQTDAEHVTKFGKNSVLLADAAKEGLGCNQ